jgi:DNA-binding response OmpR family regulator
MKKVLLVGNCNFDAPQIKSVIENNYQAEVKDIKTIDEAKMILENEDIDLVLVNRVGDQDQKNGLDLVDYLANKGGKPPIILITNFQEKMDEAVLHGALEGFGKEDILNDEGLETVKNILNPILK